MGKIGRIWQAVKRELGRTDAEIEATQKAEMLQEDAVFVTTRLYTPQDGTDTFWVADVYHPLYGHVQAVQLATSPATAGGRDVGVAAARAAGWRRADAWSFKKHGPMRAQPRLEPVAQEADHAA